MSNFIISRDLVLLDVDAGADEAVIDRLACRLADNGRATDSDGLLTAIMAREAQSATGLPGGIAIPHARSPHIGTASIGFARLDPRVEFGAPDGPADLVFMIAAPEGGGSEHMKLLSSLARALVRPDFVESLRNASSSDEVVGLVEGVVNPQPRQHAKASLRITTAVMAAGMVPPLAMALAATLRPGLFTEPERENGRAAWPLGASFISEGAIPFAAADPLRVVPSMMAAGTVAGAVAVISAKQFIGAKPQQPEAEPALAAA